MASYFSESFYIIFADDTSVESYAYDTMIRILNNEMIEIDTRLKCNGFCTPHKHIHVTVLLMFLASSKYRV